MGAYSIEVIIPIFIAALLVAVYWVYTKRRARVAEARQMKAAEERGKLQQEAQAERSKLPPDKDAIPEDLSLKQKLALITKPERARVLDNITAQVYDTMLTTETLKGILTREKTLGRRWYRYQQWIYGFNLDDNGDFKPIRVPDQIDNSPTELFNDLEQPEVAIVFDCSPDKSFMERYGKMLWWIAVMGFIMFMTISNMGV